MKLKTALITGASEGIGREFAAQLAKAGFAVTVVARNENRLKELLSELSSGDHAHIVADLTKPSDLEIVKKRISTQNFDLVVNNAGLGIYSPFADTDLESLKNMMQLNCMALLEISHAYLKFARSGDALINVSSTASKLPMPIASVYAASKAFVTGFSESIWYEQRKKGVYVMALCPGITSTNFHTRAGGDDEQIPSWFSQTPDQVVKRALWALRKRQAPIVICGPQRPLIFLSRFFPRKWVVVLSGKALDWGLSK